jgi:type I restriction enzyme M protein
MGKKTPLTLAHFGFDKNGSVLPDAALPTALIAEWLEDETNAGKPFPSYARMLAQRGKPAGDSRHSWSIDFAARRAKAREEIQPLQAKASALKNEIVDLKEQLKRLKKDKAKSAKIETLDTKIREKDKAARDLETQIANIDAAVFDLKAVNPNAITKVDSRTPDQIIENIEIQGRIVVEALGKLKSLMTAIIKP